MFSEKSTRQQLVKHLEGGQAFASIDSFLDAVPFDMIGLRPSGLPYSFYEVFFHLAYAQKDILEYSMSEDYQESNWPDDYWPDAPEPPGEEVWEDLKSDYFEDRKLLRDFILDENNDLNMPVKNSSEHSLLRELLLVIEHSAYHTGQLLIIQRLLGVYDN
ncbi:DinB family protein [Pontixanthobacter gangjinensis]|uniref:DinB family protein n=1 Tax=Christiangramia aestuarii TaxID=1028746 RepID=A0A7M3SXI7_9FLAO|nr:DinB family protein [Christiangramia aestuarii]MUP41318.1 DinB family protein [Christiangramia aestuarii]